MTAPGAEVQMRFMGPPWSRLNNVFIEFLNLKQDNNFSQQFNVRKSHKYPDSPSGIFNLRILEVKGKYFYKTVIKMFN